MAGNLRHYAIYLVSIGAGVTLISWQWRLRTRPPEVVAARVQVAPLVAEWSAVGYVECRTANISAPQVGRIVDVRVREGDAVEAGQPLASLESGEAEAGVDLQREGVRAAAAQANAAQAALQEAEQLHPHEVARASAEVAAAYARRLQAVALLDRNRRVSRANQEAARASAAAARAELLDLQQGGRPEEIVQAQAEIAAAQAAAERARIEASRQSDLYRQNAVPRNAVEAAGEALARAEAALRSRQAALDLLKQGARAERIAAARARLQAAEARVEVAESEQVAVAADERKVQEAAASLRSARAALAQARASAAHLNTLRAEAQAARMRVYQSRSGVLQARAQLNERTVVAPFAGIVGRRYVDPGDLASPSQVLFSIVEAERVWVAAEVDEQDLAPVQEGQRVVITAPAYNGREFAGKIERIGGEAVPQTEVRTGARIVRVRIALDPTPPAERSLLKPGMEVHVAGSAVLAEKALLIPNDALLTNAEGTFVWVVAEQAAHTRRVRGGAGSGLNTEILEGLKAGEQVVVSGKEGLIAGTRVTVREAP